MRKALGIIIFLALSSQSWAQTSRVKAPNAQTLRRSSPPHQKTSPLRHLGDRKVTPALHKGPLKPLPPTELPPDETASGDSEKNSLKFELSGNLEGQSRVLNNQPSAKDFPLDQDWDKSHFHVLTGNINAKTEFSESRIETNIYGRYARSPLYGEYFAPVFLNFPRKLVSRNVLRLSHNKQSGNSQEDLVVNKLFFELDGEESRFAMGRLYLNYGSGEVFNPINPFNQPLGLVSQTNVAQGSDGFKASFFPNDNSTINLFLLGNKEFESYEDQITKTLWLHGEWRFREGWQLDYVLGDDQRRLKGGAQLNFILGEAMVFGQFLYSTDQTDNRPSENLLDTLLGYDHQLTANWHFRVEYGYQEPDDKLVLRNPITGGDRMLPYEQFVALVQSYQAGGLAKISSTLVRDLKTDFTYLMGRLTWSIVDDVEVDGFINTALYWDENQNNFVQKIIPQELGVALRTFF